jgi:choline kinase
VGTALTRAIILAAGRGTRLADRNQNERPKCLLEFGGKSLLARHLEQLFEIGVAQADLVVGYEADQIIDCVGALTARPDVAFHFNPRFELGSVVSLHAAEEALCSGEDIIIMDADVLYHPAILKQLASSNIENCYLLDRDFEPGDEPVKIAVRQARMVEFRKMLAENLEFEFVGESVGFFRFSATMAAKTASECTRFEQEGLADAPHEEALRNLLLAEPEAFGFEDITGLPWVEIDFPSDVDLAENVILPAIRSDFPGF